MQTITDFLVYSPDGKVALITNRDNTDHLQSGASDSLISSGIKNHKYIDPSEASKWVGDFITIMNYYGQPIYTAEVLAKSKRLWDMSKPHGDRMINQQTSKCWEYYFEKFLNGK